MIKIKIGIDFGHSLNGQGSGAIGHLKETDENRKIGKALIEKLIAKKHIVVNCTVDKANSQSSQLKGIVAKANAQFLDLFVSIHLNAGGGHGTETYVVKGANSKTKNIATSVNTNIVNSCNFRNRGVKESNFYVLVNTNMPALLIEVCFVDSLEDKNKLNTEAVANAIFEGITGEKFVEDKKIFYRVVVGSYGDYNNATKMKNELIEKGYKETFIDKHQI